MTIGHIILNNHVRDKNKLHRPPKDLTMSKMSTQKRDLLRKGNSELASLGIFVWSIPALVAKSDNFGRIKTCPNSWICAAFFWFNANNDGGVHLGKKLFWGPIQGSKMPPKYP